MSPIDFTMDTRLLECSFDLSECGLLNCSLEDHNSIQREAVNVSFLSIEPETKYQSSLYYTNIEIPEEKIVNFTYSFEGQVTCKVLGNDKTSTIKCQDRL